MIFFFHVSNSSLSVKTIPDDVVSHDKLIKLLLQIIVLKREKVGVILQSVQLLLVAVTSLKKRFIALPDSFQLAR